MLQGKAGGDMEFRELAERYDLAKILHSGRSATVFRAADRTTGRQVAVKTITAGPSSLEEAAARFEAFAAALAMLEHPALPAVLDSGISSDGSAFFVFELLEGKGLDTMAGKLEPETALALLGLALGGLEAMAARGIAHGNLSPDNLFSINDRQVKILGLGSAAFRGAGGGAAPQETARFQAPEVAKGAVPSARSDLYSFALVASHLLGAAVTPGDSPSVQMPFSVTMELANDGALRTILERLLRREPAERPSFREVRSAFRQALGQAPAQPAAAAPPAPIAPPAPVTPPAVSKPLPAPLPTPPLAPVQSMPALPPLPPITPAAPAPPKEDVLKWEIPDLPRQEAPKAASPKATPPKATTPKAEAPQGDVLQGDVLQAISDEVLNALTAAPPAPSAPARKAGAGAAAAAVSTATPDPARKRLALVFGALAAVLVLGILAAVWMLHRPAPESSAPAAEAGPVVPPRPSAAEAIAQVEQARVLLAMGDEAKARETIRALSTSGQSALPPEACAHLAELETVLHLMDVERFPADLQRGLQTGDLNLLRSAVSAGATLGAAMPAELQESFGTARRLVELHRLAEADAAQGKHTEVLERMAELASLSPKLIDSLELREKAAAALESEAEGLAREARYDEAVAKLEPLQRTWANREGLSARLDGYRTAKDEEARQQALLAAIPTWEKRRKPSEPLEMIRAIKPTPHLAAQIEEARKRLEDQLAVLDQDVPVIELRPGYGLEYSRGNPVELSFRVKDDYGVKSVQMWAKQAGGKMREMSLEEHRSGGYWSIELPVSYHQNETVELYLLATDTSGHEGWFGTKDKPMKLTRIGSNRL
jgi:serine/threonine protein kinase